MPRKRKRFYKKYKKKYSTLPKKNYKDLKFLKKAIEMKLRDTTTAGVNIDNTGNCHFIPNIGQSSAENARNGCEITARKIKIRGYIDNSAEGANSVDNIVRLILVRKKDNQNSTLSIPDLLQDGVDVNSFMQKDRSHNYHIYWDQTIALDTTQHSKVPFKVSINVNSQIKYDKDVTTGGPTDCQENGFYLVYFGTEATYPPDLYATYRITYADL